MVRGTSLIFSANTAGWVNVYNSPSLSSYWRLMNVIKQEYVNNLKRIIIKKLCGNNTLVLIYWKFNFGGSSGVHGPSTATHITIFGTGIKIYNDEKSVAGDTHPPLLHFSMDCRPFAEFGSSPGLRSNILCCDFNQILQINIGTGCTQDTVSLHSTEKYYCWKFSSCLATQECVLILWKSCFLPCSLVPLVSHIKTGQHPSCVLEIHLNIILLSTSES